MCCGNLKTMINFLKGKKSYLVAIAIGAVTTLHSLGYIDDETFKTILGILNSLGMAALAAKINRNR